jgi:hypothetical protein
LCAFVVVSAEARVGTHQASLENFRKGKDLEQQFATIEDVFAYFPDLDKAVLPMPERKLPATQWHIELPLFDSNDRVNMLRASLPTSLQRSVNERVLLRNELQSVTSFKQLFLVVARFGSLAVIRLSFFFIFLICFYRHELHSNCATLNMCSITT